MTTPEGKVKEQVKKLLRKYNVYWHMPVQNGMGAPSLDFVCCVRGRYFAVETKAGSKALTPRQEETSAAIRKAKGKVFHVNEVNSGFSNLECWLQEVCDDEN